jgi:type IV secretion system protein VirB2
LNQFAITKEQEMRMIIDFATSTKVKNIASSFFTAALLVTVLAAPDIALAAGGDVGEAGEKVTNFLEQVKTLLKLASIAVVTIAVIFAGYQIAFAHKRIADVAPILIGGFLIGAAGQLATMLIGTGT